MRVEKGKFVVILGPSGAGKSTLLNIMNEIILLLIIAGVILGVIVL